MRVVTVVQQLAVQLVQRRVDSCLTESGNEFPCRGEVGAGLKCEGAAGSSHYVAEECLRTLVQLPLRKLSSDTTCKGIPPRKMIETRLYSYGGSGCISELVEAERPGDSRR